MYNNNDDMHDMLYNYLSVFIAVKNEESVVSAVDNVLLDITLHNLHCFLCIILM